MKKEEIIDYVTEKIIQKLTINQTTKDIIKELKQVLETEDYTFENNLLIWQNKKETKYKSFLIEENRISYYSSIQFQEPNETEEKIYLTVCENKNGKLCTHKSKKNYKTTYTPFERQENYTEKIYHDYYENEKITQSSQEKNEINKTYDLENNQKTNDQTYTSKLIYQLTTGEYLTRELDNNQTKYYIYNKCPITFDEETKAPLEKTQITQETFENLMKKSYDPYLLINDESYYDYKNEFKIK